MSASERASAVHTPRKTAKAPNLKLGWKGRIGVLLGIVLLRLLSLTWRVRERGDAPWKARLAAKQPFVFVLWHGQLLPLAHVLRRTGISVLISDHRDGEVIARILRSMGYASVRGSTTRGGGRALLGLIRELKNGRTVVLTPDGPRGPVGVFQAGALVAAQRAGVPVVTVAVQVDRAWRLNSWDRFIVPKPFARLSVAFGEPTAVLGDSVRAAAEETERFAAMLRTTEEQARA